MGKELWTWCWPGHLYSLKRQILSQESTHCGRLPQISPVVKQVCTGDIFCSVLQHC
uniref:Uncharacterized protein n=1 Tax=Arundo donax TaxID=35708 RepID=A0A0A9DRM8_ARUDO